MICLGSFSLITAQANTNVPTEMNDVVKNEVHVQELGKWLQTYYKNPEPSAIATKFQSLSRLPQVQDRLPTIAGFVYGVLRTEPDPVKMVLQYAAASPEFIPAFVLALKLLNVTDGNEYAKLKNAFPQYAKTIDTIRESNIQRFDDIELEEGAWAIDLWWGRYFSTGSQDVLRPFFQAMEKLYNPSYKEQFLSHATAIWTLHHIAKKDPHLMLQLKQYQKTCIPSWCSLLTKITSVEGAEDVISIHELEQAANDQARQ